MSSAPSKSNRSHRPSSPAANVAVKKAVGKSAAAVIDDDDECGSAITITPSSSTKATASATGAPAKAAKAPAKTTTTASVTTSLSTSSSSSSPSKSARPKSAAKKSAAKKDTTPAAAATSSAPAVSNSSSSSSSSSSVAGSDEKKLVNPYRSSEPVFTADDLKFFDTNGYIVLRNAVPREDCDAVVRDIWQFLGFNPAKDGIDACYNPPLNPNALVEMYHSQAQWNNRCNPRIYSAFCQLWGRDDLWCSLDRVGVKLPSVDKHPHYRNKGFTHWDYDVTDDGEHLPMQLQGAMALVDTDPTMGGFHCYPGMHRYLKEWMTEYDVKIDEAAIKRFYTSGFPIKVPDYEHNLKGKQHDIVEMKAGDLVIWRGELAHGNGENLSPRPRLAQYITMHPQRYTDEQLRAKREECWRKRLPGGQVLWPQLPISNAHGSTGGRGTKSGAEQSARRVATLTDLGKLLLGLEPYPDHLIK